MRALIPQLPREGWTLLVGDLVSAVGSGLTLPFLLVYLHQVRGLGLGEAGLALSTIALAGFVGNPVGGSLADRVGARAALGAGLCCSAAGSAWLAFAARPWQLFAAVATLGFGAAVVWPARDAFRAALVPAELRSGAFALAHAVTNLGLGVGALLAALLVVGSSPARFQALFLLDAGSFLAVMPVLLRLPAPEQDRGPDEAGQRPGYREILRDRAFLRLWTLTALIVGAGFAQYTAAFPAVATGRAGLDGHLLALCFAANTVAVVAFQLPLLRYLSRRRLTTGLALACATTGAAWLLVLVGGGAPSPAAAAAVLSLAMVVLALGETALSPSAPALANALAPDRLRGRYNGVYTLAWTGGFAAGPALSGAVLAAGHTDGLLLALVAACALAAAGSLRLAGHLPMGVDHVDAGSAGLPEPLPA